METTHRPYIPLLPLLVISLGFRPLSYPLLKQPVTPLTLLMPIYWRQEARPSDNPGIHNINNQKNKKATRGKKEAKKGKKRKS